jgi:hypothetical protein
MPENALVRKLSDIVHQDLSREAKAARIAEAIWDPEPTVGWGYMT